MGGRYGSTTREGVSYTEKEYDYAVAKGIHVIALLHGEPEQLSVAKSDLDESLREKLASFRSRVSAGRLVKFWRSPEELLQQTVLSLTHAFKAHPRAGWIRGSEKVDAQVANELSRLSRENLELRNQRREADFAIIDALIETVDCQYLIWMMETGQELNAFWSWHVYQLRGGGAGSGQLDRTKFQSKLTGIGMVRGAGGGQFIALTDLGDEFARWLVAKGRKCDFFRTPQGGWGDAEPGSTIDGWLKQQEAQANSFARPMLSRAKTPKIEELDHPPDAETAT